MTSMTTVTPTTTPYTTPASTPLKESNSSINALPLDNLADYPEREEVSDEEFKAELAKKIAEGQHPTQFAYTFWFNRRIQGARTQENYEKNIKRIGSFNTVEEFWSYYNHLIRPNDLPNTCDYHLFKRGIKPMWEDEANKQGGKWIVRLKKGLASRCWEDLLLSVVGEQFDIGDEICGVVVSIRFQEDIISIWNRSAVSALSNDVESKIRTTLKKLLNLPASTAIEYKAHDASMKDNSSFRNTEHHPWDVAARSQRASKPEHTGFAIVPSSSAPSLSAAGLIQPTAGNSIASANGGIHSSSSSTEVNKP